MPSVAERARADDARLRPRCPATRASASTRARAHLGVAVQEQDVGRPWPRRALVAGAAEAHVLGVAHARAAAGKRARHRVGRAVGAGVVDHDDLERAAAAASQRGQAAQQVVPRVVGDDDDARPRGRAVIARRGGRGQRLARRPRGLRPGVAGGQRAAARPTSPRAAPRREDALERRRHRRLVARLHEQRGLAEDLAQGGPVADHDGHAARHRLQRGQAEALVFGEEHRHVRGRVAVGQRRLVDEAGEADAAARGPARARARAGRAAGWRAVLAHDLQREVGTAADAAGRPRAAARAGSGG